MTNERIDIYCKHVIKLLNKVYRNCSTTYEHSNLIVKYGAGTIATFLLISALTAMAGAGVVGMVASGIVTIAGMFPKKVKGFVSDSIPQELTTYTTDKIEELINSYGVNDIINDFKTSIHNAKDSIQNFSISDIIAIPDLIKQGIQYAMPSVITDNYRIYHQKLVDRLESISKQHKLIDPTPEYTAILNEYYKILPPNYHGQIKLKLLELNTLINASKLESLLDSLSIIEYKPKTIPKFNRNNYPKLVFNCKKELEQITGLQTNHKKFFSKLFNTHYAFFLIYWRTISRKDRVYIYLTHQENKIIKNTKIKTYINILNNNLLI